LSALIRRRFQLTYFQRIIECESLVDRYETQLKTQYFQEPEELSRPEFTNLPGFETREGGLGKACDTGELRLSHPAVFTGLGNGNA